MKVAFTIAAVIDVPDETPLEDVRGELLDLINGTITQDTKKFLDENLVEYDVIEESCSCITSQGRQCCRKCPEKKIRGITGCTGCSRN